MRLSLVALLAATAAAAQPPAPAVREVGLTDARWTAGLWAERFEVCRTATVPAMGDRMTGADNRFLHNFRVAAGLDAGEHRTPAWNDGDLYKWLEAAAAVHALCPDAKLDRRMDEAIAVIAKAQRADGYLHTPVLIAARRGEPLKPFQNHQHFEMYNFGHLFTAACVHHQATGKTALLEVAKKAADHLCQVFAKPTPELARNAVCPSHYMGLIDLSRETGDDRYRKLAVKLLDMRDLVTDGGDDNQDRLPFRKQTEAVGHAVRANYLYAGVADVYAETGDDTLLRPLQKIWANAVGRKMYITGACGALYDGASPDGSREQKTITRTHQAYGRDYQLPNSTAHNETCAAIGNVLWNWRMLKLTGEAKYADLMETALLNAVLAGVSLDGKRFFYTNTLRQLDTMPVSLRWSREREEWISCFCCPPNVARIVAQASRYAYGRSDRGVWVHLYGGSTLDTTLPDGRRVKLTQETEYPWDGRVKLTVNTAPAGECSLFFRVPGWAKATELSVNGKGVKAACGKYAEVRREWKAGDVVTLSLPMSPRLVEAHPLVEEARNHVAVTRGPLVYCLESQDLPKGASVPRVAVAADVKLTPRFDRKLLGGVTVLDGSGEATADEPWGDELYRDLKPTAAKPTDVKFIPYFAWANRGKSEMTVWLPLRR
jgi:DUF1680 family protein